MVHRLTLDHALSMRLTAYAIALLYLALGIVLALTSSSPYQFGGGARTLVIGGLGGLAVFVITILVHELVHGLFMRLFGGRPRYGVGRIGWLGIYAYATAPGVPFTLWQMTVICLAPLVAISGLTLAVLWLIPAAAGFAALAFVTNVSGAAGDLWMVAQMWRFRNCRELRLVDVATGLDIHTPDPAGAAIARRLVERSRGGIVHRILLRWLAASTGLLVVAMLLAVLLSMSGAGETALGAGRFAIARYGALPDGGFEMTLDLNVVGAVGLLFALISLVAVRPAKRPRSSDSGDPGSSPHPAFL